MPRDLAARPLAGASRPTARAPDRAGAPPDQAQPEPLPPAHAARLAELARALKTAIRAVSLYPEGHTGIEGPVRRLLETVTRAAGELDLDLVVLPDGLLVGGRASERPDEPVRELAALLHRHLVGRVVLDPSAPATSWHALIRLLARAPEEVREAGGVQRCWQDQRQPGIELFEVDYSTILRDGAADTRATVEALISSCLKDDSNQRLSIESLQDPARLSALSAKLSATLGDADGESQATVVVQLLRGVAEGLSDHTPEEVVAGLERLSTVVRHVSADAMAELLARRDTPEAMAGSIDVIETTIEAMQDGEIADFVVSSVSQAQGATERLAEAFQALVPDPERKRQVLVMAGRSASETALAQDANFPELWDRVERMLTSYSDEPFVSRAYARELSSARTRAVEVEETDDDPPERVDAWLATVADAALLDLDLQLLLDLLTLESDAYRWRDVADLAAAQVERQLESADLDRACALGAAIAAGASGPQSADETGRRAFARGALERLAGSAGLRAALTRLGTYSEEGFRSLVDLCQLLGPPLVEPVARLLASGPDGRARRRARELLVGLGPEARAAIEALLQAPQPAVRRTAAAVLREIGGTSDLDSLVTLLTDREPGVQREAIRALLELDAGAGQACASAAASLTRLPELRLLLLDELGRGRPVGHGLCAHLARHPAGRAMTPLRLAAIDALAGFDQANAVDALRAALHDGSWRRPYQTRALRRAAARSLARSASADARHVLEEAARQGRRGTRAAAAAALRASEGR